MNNFLKILLKFLFYLVPVYLICLVIIYYTGTAKFIPNVLDKTKNDGFLLSRLRELPVHKNVDFLFLGSSHACREFDPRIFKNYGFTSFNLGSSGQTPINSEFLLKKNIESIKPKHIIFEVYFFFFSNDGVESAIDIISNSEIDRYNLSLALSKADLKTYNTISFISINRLFQPLDKIREHSLKTDRYIKGGYIEKILTDSINRRLSISNVKRRIYINQDQLSALTRIIELTKNNGIKLSLVAAPVTREFLHQYDYKEFSDIIKRTAISYNVPYLDYNNQTILQFDSYTDFYDSNHLTQIGVDKFNKDLIENYLIKH